MGRHADPDPRHFWSSLANAFLRGLLALALVVGLFAALATIGPRPPRDGPVMLVDPGYSIAVPDGTAGSPGEGGPAGPAVTDPPRDERPEPDSDPRAEDDALTDDDPDPAAGATEPEPAAEPAEPEDAAAAVPGTAPPPQATTVQVLDGVGRSPHLEAFVAALTDLGYNVVATNPASTDYAVTTVLYSEGHEAAARALQARDPRIADLRPNPGLSEEVHLHVVLGADWSP